MKYRSDIDGLRAVAILLVLIYHAGLSLFPSGFVGVDVFFVISGFLITRIIQTGLAKGNFSFIDFYKRRLWRLQPVFICLLICVTGLSLVFFLPDDLIEYSRSARKASLFISNLFFNRTTTGYFAPDSHQLPLLHTWSLSIEWQCYLVLPVFIYALHRIFSPKNLLIVIWGLMALSMGLALYNAQESPAATYYLSSGRIFEFLMGSAVALLSLKNTQHLLGSVDNSYPELLRPATCSQAPEIQPYSRTICIHQDPSGSREQVARHRSLNCQQTLFEVGGLLSIISIFYIASLGHILIGYPNYYAFVVCMATAYLIALGTINPQSLVIRLLSCKPLVFTGLLSYSLYIWHWVVFASLRYQGIQETPWVLSAAFGFVFILAYLSWRYIEKPARKWNHISMSTSLASLVLVPLLLTHGSSYLIKSHSGFPQRFNQELVTIYDKLNQYQSVQRPLCISNKHINTDLCTIGSKKANSKKGLMIGDSFSNHYWGFMDTLAKAANLSVVAEGTSSCLTLPGIYLYDWWYFKNRVYQECHDQTAHYFQMIAEQHYDYVFIGEIWNNYLSDSVINQLGDKQSIDLAKERITEALDEALSKITNSGAKPVLIKTTALMEAGSYSCFFKHIKLRQAYDPAQCAFALSLTDREQWFSNLFDTMKRKYPSLVLIDPKQVQCPKGICPVDVDGVPMYRDAGHITDYASYQLGIRYLQQIGNPLRDV